MSISTQAVSSKGFNQLLSEATPALLEPLRIIVTQYIFSEPQGWVAEWSGPRGFDVLTEAVLAAKTPLTHGPASIVVQYLKKSDIFGLAAVEKAAGGKNVLAKLIGPYNPEHSLPLEIDDELQKDLTELFNGEALELFNDEALRFPEYKKATELFSLYWCPAGISLRSANWIADGCGQGLDKLRDSDRAVMKEYGDVATQKEGWLQFSNGVFGFSRQSRQQQILLPTGFEFPRLSEAVFCVFIKYICTKSCLLNLSFQARSPNIRCKENDMLAQYYVVNSRDFDYCDFTNPDTCTSFGVSVDSADWQDTNLFGVAPMRKYTQDLVKE